MRHPIESYNEEQARTLASLPDDLREFWARQFRIGNATYFYQNQFTEVAKLESAGPDAAPPDDLLEWLEQQLSARQESQSANELLRIYFDEWLEGLPERIRHLEKTRGLEAKRSWTFRRYVLERNDLGMDEFLKRNLSAEDYAYHRELGQSIRND